MVLTLKEKCLKCIINHIDVIPINQFTNLDPNLIELLINRIFNINIKTDSNFYLSFSKIFFQKVNFLKFDTCLGLNDDFLEKICHEQTNHFSFQSFYIRKCPNITDNGISKFLTFYAKNLVNLVINNMHISLRKSLENLRSHKLNFVDLSFCSEVLDEDLWFLCKNNSNIQTLRLTHCTKLTNSGISLALNMLKNLRNLDLEGIKDSGPYFYDLNSGFNPIKNLINISFCGSNSLDKTEMKDFFKSCPSIKELNIYYSNIGSNSIRMNLVKDNHPLLVLPQSLISLSLYRPIITDPNILINSLKRLENLKDLSLFCVECLDDNYFTELLKSIGNQLRSIKLGGYMSLNNQLGDQSIESIGQYCKNLENISFELFSLRADFKNLETLFLCTETSAKLKSVNFSACRAINRSLLVKFGLNCKNIIKLDFSGLDKIIDDDLISILALNLNQLEYIDLKACSNCTDNGIVALASNCPLKCLVLSGLYKLTDKSLYTMGNFLEKSLEELYLAGCLKLTQTAIIYLLTRCTNRLNFQPNVYKFNLQ